MGSVSEQIGLNEFGATSETASKISEILANLILVLAKKQNFSDPDMHKLRAIINHLKEGKDCKLQYVKEQDSPIFESILEMKHIPYVKIRQKDENGIYNHVYVTRDKDARALEEVWKRFSFEIGIGMNEMTAMDFINQNMNNDICQSLGYDKTEIELFKREAAKYNISFAVLESKTAGKYDILYLPRDTENMKKALMNVAYEFSGKEGATYKNSLGEDISNREKFDLAITPTGKETLYVVDSKNPNHFISVTQNGFIVHELKRDTAKSRDGSSVDIITDANTIAVSEYDRNQLMKYVAGMEKPLILNKEEMTIVKGMDASGRAILIPNEKFKAEYEKLQESLSKRTDYYKGVRPKEEIKTQEKVHAFSNLPDTAVSEIYDKIEEQKLSDKVILIGNNLLYSENEKPFMDTVLENCLFKDKTALEKIEDTLFYTGKGDITLTKEPKEPFYILSANNPKYVIKIDEKGFEVHEKGNISLSIERSDATYLDSLESLLSTMKEMVVMTKEELEKPATEKSEIIRQKVNSIKKNEAYIYFIDMENNKKEELYQTSSEADAKFLDEKQKEAAKKYYSHETVVTYVERNLAEKIIDHDLSAKLKETQRTTVEVDR